MLGPKDPTTSSGMEDNTQPHTKEITAVTAVMVAGFDRVKKVKRVVQAC